MNEIEWMVAAKQHNLGEEGNDKNIQKLIQSTFGESRKTMNIGDIFPSQYCIFEKV